MKLLLVPFVLAAMIAISANSAEANTASYTCKLKARAASVYLKMNGPDNNPSFCRIVSKGWASRFYGTLPGSRRCTFQMDAMEIYVHVYARSSYIGNYFCDGLEDSLDGWYRL